MDPRIAEFYDRLAQGYRTTIRQLVPQYEKMVNALAAALAPTPGRILDIGAGDGSLTAHLADRFPSTQFVALEPAAAMAHAARRALSRFGGRCALVECHVEVYVPDVRFDAVVTSLVLHNLEDVEKRRTLNHVFGWLVPSGTLAWGDFVRHADPAVHRRLMEERIGFARAHGCPESIIAANFAKEEKQDNPWAVAQMVDGLTDAGFDGATLLWQHSTFAVVGGVRAMS